MMKSNAKNDSRDSQFFPKYNIIIDNSKDILPLSSQFFEIFDIFYKKLLRESI